MAKRYLFTPGPTPVPPEVLAAVAAPVVHHRSPDFLPVYERVLTTLVDNIEHIESTTVNGTAIVKVYL